MKLLSCHPLAYRTRVFTKRSNIDPSEFRSRIGYSYHYEFNLLHSRSYLPYKTSSPEHSCVDLIKESLQIDLKSLFVGRKVLVLREEVYEDH